VCSLRELKSLVEARPVCLGVPEQLVFLNSAEHASSFSQACLFSWTYITISTTVQRLIHNGKQLGRLRQRSRKSQRRRTHQANSCFLQLFFLFQQARYARKRGVPFRQIERRTGSRQGNLPNAFSTVKEAGDTSLVCIMRIDTHCINADDAPCLLPSRCSAVVERTGHRVRHLTASGKLLCLKPGRRAACA